MENDNKENEPIDTDRIKSLMSPFYQEFWHRPPFCEKLIDEFKEDTIKVKLCIKRGAVLLPTIPESVEELYNMAVERI